MKPAHRELERNSSSLTAVERKELLRLLDKCSAHLEDKAAAR